MISTPGSCLAFNRRTDQNDDERGTKISENLRVIIWSDTMKCSSFQLYFYLIPKKTKSKTQFFVSKLILMQTSQGYISTTYTPKNSTRIFRTNLFHS